MDNKRKTDYLVKHETPKGISVSTISASSYADAAKQVENWIAIVKKPTDVFG